jgi:hypothetical protein
MHCTFFQFTDFLSLHMFRHNTTLIFLIFYTTTVFNSKILRFVLTKNTVERKPNYYEHKHKWYLVLVTYDIVLWKSVKNNWVYWRLWTVDDSPEDGTRCAETYVGANDH